MLHIWNQNLAGAGKVVKAEGGGNRSEWWKEAKVRLKGGIRK